MKKISFIILACSVLFFACSKEDDNIIRLSSQETKLYCEAIAGSYEAKGYTILVDLEDFNKSDVIGKQVDIDGVFIDIDADIQRSMIIWHVPINSLAYLLPENSDVRRAFEEKDPISFLTTYSFESNVQKVNGENLVNFTFKPVPYRFTTEYGGKSHLITVNIEPCGIYLPYTTDMNAVREKFLKSDIRFDVTSMKVDDEEFKNFDLIVASKISTARER